MIPGVWSSVASGLDFDVEPSPPVLPLAHTVSMPALASASWSRTIVGSVAPHEQLIARIGGQVVAGTPGAHGPAWWARTHANAFWRPISGVVVEIITSGAPGATPPPRVPSGSL